VVLSLPKHLKWTRLGIGQVLIGLTFISLYFSPALSNLFEFIAVILVASSNALRGRVRDFILSPLAKWYGLFLLVLILGAVNGILRGNSDLSEMWGWRKVLLLPLGATLFMGQEVAKRRLAKGFVAVSIAFALWSNINFLIGLNPVVAKNYAVQGMFYTVTVLFCIAFYFSARSFRIKSALLLAAGLLTFSVFYLTTGRSGYLAWLVIVPVAIFLASRYSITTRIVVSFCVFILGIGFFLISSNAKNSVLVGISEIKHANSQQIPTRMGDRVIMWQKTLEIAPKYALLGAGLAGFSRAFDDRWKPSDAVGWQGLSDPHNQYLKIAIELGVPGLLVFLLFIGRVIKASLNEAGLQRLNVSVLFGWCATSFFSAHFTTFHEGHFIWLFVGVFLCGSKISSGFR
jgi:O-antigen ligase